MKRLYLLTILVGLLTIPTIAQNYTHSAVYNEPEYVLDRKLAEYKDKPYQPTTAGIITRAGYAFNYDAFTYGVSFFYQWSRVMGVTAGFDGYYIPNKLIYRTIQNDTISSNAFALPLWDIRAGFMLSKYFLFGGMIGKSNIGDVDNLINMRQNAWFVNNKESNVIYGGFITFILPVSKHFGFNLDFAVTNKTGFNVGAGINFTIPVK